MSKKTKATSGADERTPSLPQYFSWINSTNEGSTEEQTVTNLEYFKWLHDTHGMKLKIYAWDAGNLDGAGYYDNPNESERLKKQYPNGYKPCVDKAAEFGCHLGVWGGADGYGDTPEEEAKRHELLVSLCRDLGLCSSSLTRYADGPEKKSTSCSRRPWMSAVSTFPTSSFLTTVSGLAKVKSLRQLIL